MQHPDEIPSYLLQAEAIVKVYRKVPTSVGR